MQDDRADALGITQRKWLITAVVAAVLAIILAALTILLLVRQHSAAAGNVFSGLSMLLLTLAFWAGSKVLRRQGEARLDKANAQAASDIRKAYDLVYAVIDAGPDAFWAKDTAGRYVVAGQRALAFLGADRDSVIGRRDAEFLRPDLARVIEAADQMVIAGRETVVSDETGSDNGRLRRFQTIRSPWMRGDEVVGMIGISRDVTEQRVGEATLRNANAELERQVAERSRDIEAAQAQVRQMQKMESVGQLTGGIAHDFNNMLAIIIGSLDLARRRFNSDPDRALTSIAHAEEGAKRAAALTARLLAFSRLQPLSPQAVELNKLVGGMSELLGRTIGEHLKVETVLAGGLWPVFVDASQLESAILNLCVNARDAMPGGGRLTIETCNAHLDEEYVMTNPDVVAGQYALVSVSDTGEGMPADVVARAFDPFFTTKGAGAGTGLGLSQVYGFVRQSGGHVKLYSEQGHGTSVKIYLPRHLGALAVTNLATPGERPTGKADEFILVTEDDADVRQMSAAALGELGYGVIQAANGDEALQQLDRHPRIQLLFTDIVMPGMTGRQLADLARQRRTDLKVLYTTGYSRSAVVHNGVLDPGIALLPKPFSVDALARKVREVLDTPPPSS